MFERIKRLARALGWGSWRWLNLEAKLARAVRQTASGALTQYGDLLADLRQVAVSPEGDILCSREVHEAAIASPPTYLVDPSLSRPWQERCVPREEESEVAREGLTIAIPRCEWLNYYHSVVDLYNCYFLTRFFGEEPLNTRILFLDHHDVSPFEELWTTHFKEVLTPKHFERTLGFERLVVGPINYESPFGPGLGPRPPYFEDFSRLFQNLTETPDQLTFVSRSLAKQRKLANEKELLEDLKEQLPQAKIECVLFENLTPLEQISLMSKTKLLVGMHGAGLTHSVFLPSQSGLFEIFPGLLHAFRVNFTNIAIWRRLSYRRHIDWHRLTEPAEGNNYLEIARVADKVAAHWNSMSSETRTQDQSQPSSSVFRKLL